VYGRSSCAGESTPHIRVYADGDDHLYNVSWGYYVLGTTHKDYQECVSGSKFGWSEDMEDWFGTRASNRGYGITRDWGAFYNREPARWEQNHYWQNSGYATWVNVP
jgi:hypothetical protein